ncbi:MAG TPA: hypothetical protein PLH16_04855 [Candidatus Omnitrophota bacterium]|jgi:uncharacterized protein YjeT (DUF2065 family)|nr:hypothetical protein [Candidatus Omnitrophota bacterium]
MTYFRILGIAIGSWMVLTGLWVVFRPAARKRMALAVTKEDRPRWVLHVGILWTVLFLVTIGMLFRAPTPAAFVVTFMMLLTLFKVIAGVLFWKRCREMVLALMEEPLALRVVMLSSAAVGAALLTMGMIF